MAPAAKPKVARRGRWDDAALASVDCGVAARERRRRDARDATLGKSDDEERARSCDSSYVFYVMCRREPGA
jgi:hypothetical protein